MYLTPLQGRHTVDRFKRTAGHIWDVFFGSVQRTQYTLAGFAVLYCLTHPAFTTALFNLMLEIGIIVLVISIAGRHAFGIKGGGKKKKSP